MYWWCISNSAGRVRVHGHHQGCLQRRPIQPHDHTSIESLKHLGWKGPRESNWRNLLPEAGPGLGYPEPYQAKPWTFPTKENLPLLWTTYTIFNCSHGEQFFSYIQISLPWSNTCLLPLVLSPCSLVARAPPSNYTLGIGRLWLVVPTLSFLFSINKLNSFNLSSYIKFSSPL